VRLSKPALAAAAVLALGGGGCYALSASAGPTTAERAAAADLGLPLDSYQLTYQEQSDATRATDLMIRACMSKAGFDWYVASGPSTRPDPVRRRYGVIDPQVAERFGYRPPSSRRSEEVERRRSGILENPEAQKVYYGSKDGKKRGCVDGAREELARGAEKSGDFLPVSLSRKSLESSGKDPAVVAVQRKWKKCMAARGYDYETPSAAVDDPAWDPDSAVVTAKERAVASADVECKYEVDMIKVWVGAESRIQRTAITENASRLKVLKRALAIYNANVRSALNRLDG
jgi:hypothetical protein